jgi:hypothetical protein
MSKLIISLEQRAAADGPFHRKWSNGETLRLVVVRDSSIAVPSRENVA